MKKKRYIHKLGIVVFLCMFMLIFFMFYGIRWIGLEPRSNLILFYAMCTVTLVFLFLMNTQEPIYITEYDDRLVFQYEHFKKRIIMFSDIASYEYPFKLVRERDVSAHRITLVDGEVLILHDAYSGLKDFVRRWQAMEVNTAETRESRYVDTGESFSFAPSGVSALGGQALMAVALFVSGVARVFSGASLLYTVILLVMGILLVYVVGMAYTRFSISGGELVMKNPFVRRYNRTVILSDVKWVSFHGTSLHVRMSDGETITVLYNLPDDKRKKFAEALQGMGIVCL